MPDEEQYFPQEELPHISEQIASIVTAIAHLRSQVPRDIRIQRLALLGTRLRKFRQNVDILKECLLWGDPRSDKFIVFYVQLVRQCQLVIGDLHNDIIRGLRSESLDRFDLDKLAPFENYLDTNPSVFILVTQLLCL